MSKYFKSQQQGWNPKYARGYMQQRNSFCKNSTTHTTRQLKELGQNPEEWEHKIKEALLSEGKFSHGRAAFALITALALYGAVSAAAALPCGTEAKSLESKIKLSDFKAKKPEPLANIDSKDLEDDVEQFTAGKNYGVTSLPDDIDITSVSSGQVGLTTVYAINMKETPAPDAEYDLKLIDKSTNITKVQAQFSPTVNKIAYDDKVVEGKIKTNLNSIEIPLEAEKTPGTYFLATTKKTFGSDEFTDKLCNGPVNFDKDLVDFPNDLDVRNNTPNPPPEVLAKMKSFDITTARKEGNNIMVELAAPPVFGRDLIHETVLYQIYLGNLWATVGESDAGSANLIDYSAVPEDLGVIYSSGNNIIVPILHPEKLASDFSLAQFGDKLVVIADLQYVPTGDPKQDSFLVSDTLTSGNYYAQENSVPSPEIPPKFVFSLDDLLRPTDPFADDSDVSNNHNMKASPLLLYKKIVPYNNEKFVEWWLYFKSNPVCLVAVNGKCLVKDHHTHDWEVVIDHYTANNTFIERATSFHIKVPGINPGWLFSKNLGDVYVEAGGHALAPENIFDDKTKLSIDPTNGEYLLGWKTLGKSEIKNISLISGMEYLESGVGETNEQYAAAGYPPAPNPLLLGERALNPWHQNVYSQPGEVFGGQLFQNQNQPALLSVEVSGPVETSAKIGDKTLGMADGKPMADIYGTYAKENSSESLTVLLNSYDDGQLEVKGVGDGEYTIKIQYLDVSDVSNLHLLAKTYTQKISAGDKDVIKIRNSSPQFERYSNSALNWAAPVIGGAAALLTAAGLYKYLQKRRKEKPADEKKPAKDSK